MLVEGLITNLIKINQLCDQDLKESFNKGECIVTSKKHEKVIKGSRSKDKCYIWISESTPRETFKDDKKTYDKISKGRTPGTILEHPTRYFSLK